MFLKPYKIQNLTQFLFQLSQEIFRVSLAAIFIFFLLEDYKKGFVTLYFNPHWLWLVVLPTGFIAFFSKNRIQVPSFRKPFFSDWFLAITLSLIAGIMVLAKTISWGLISFLFSLVIIFAVFFLSFWLLKEETAQ